MGKAEGKGGTFAKILKGEGDMQLGVLPGVLQKPEQIGQDRS